MVGGGGVERDVDGGDGVALARQVAAHQVLVAVLPGLRALVCNTGMSRIQKNVRCTGKIVKDSLRDDLCSLMRPNYIIIDLITGRGGQLLLVRCLSSIHCPVGRTGEGDCGGPGQPGHAAPRGHEEAASWR